MAGAAVGRRVGDTPQTVAARAGAAGGLVHRLPRSPAATMDFPAFRRLVERLSREIPAAYLDGIAAVEVSPKALPHPTRGDVYTMGECIPMHGEGGEVLSRVVLYHGSFRALSRLRDDFAWREEAWDTLTHELRHHLEWRANADALEAYDWAAEQNFARHDGQPFDPLFHRSGEELDTGVFRVDDDVFLDRVVRARPSTLEAAWHGATYTVTLPDAALPLFLTLDGLREPPPGDVVLVVRRKPRLRDLFRRPHPPTQGRASARRSSG